MKDDNFKCRYLLKRDIKANTDDLISKHYGDLVLLSLPIEIDAILEREGFHLRMNDAMFLEDKVFAQLSIDGETIYIRGSDYDGDNLTKFRQLRFGLAHELGHAVLHPYLINALRKKFEQSPDPDPIEAFIHLTEKYISDSAYSKFEWQANFFGGNLLVPDKMLRYVFNLIMSEYTEDAKSGMAMYSLEEIYGKNTNMFGDMADYFDVNPYTLFVRVSQEGLWNDFQRIYQ